MTNAGNGEVNIRRVVFASAAGTTFEWYDFFLFVPLATIISRTFFAGLNDTAAYVFALLSFGAGFAFRPLGALLFGRIGDRVGRKATFLITISLMGTATFAIGLLPTYAGVGVLSPILFIALRLLQGIALGGEWGGAAIYIAEHAPPDRRGLMTSWLGTSAAFGLGGALVVTLAIRTAMGEPAFNAWGWRLPFLLSAVLVGFSIWIRLKLQESPAFRSLREADGLSTSPYREAFLHWPNTKRVLLALFALMCAQGSVWYMTFFYAQFFMEKIIKVPPEVVGGVMLAAVGVSAPLYLLFGGLSDRIGRKWIMFCGMALVIAALFPGFRLLTRFANPGLDAAALQAPVVVVADPAECSLQFDPIGKTQFRSSCDIAKTVLASGGVPYRNQAAPPGTLAAVRIGGAIVPSVDGRELSADALKAAKAGVEGAIRAALREAGYPDQAPAGDSNLIGLFLTLMVFVVGATALYGPQAACLVELFPIRVRYTALSLPYHIGTGWVGGFLPAASYAMVAASGDIYFGLWYPLVMTAISAATTLFFLPETRGRDLSS
jgi:MFS family permease